MVIYLVYVASPTLVVGVLAIAAVMASSPLVELVTVNLAVSQPDQWCTAGASQDACRLLLPLRAVSVQRDHGCPSASS